MKLHEIVTEQELISEVNWRSALAAGTIAASAMAPSHLTANKAPDHSPAQVAAMQKLYHNQGIDQLSRIIQKKYKGVDDQTARQIADLAQKHAKPGFPRAVDILSVIGIESSFRPTAVSQLKNDPARGLMQMRPGVWGLKKSDLATIEKQIERGADVLHQYYEKLGSAKDALHAYNIGITNLRKNKGLNPKYVDKFRKEREQYDTFSPSYASVDPV